MVRERHITRLLSLALLCSVTFPVSANETPPPEAMTFASVKNLVSGDWEFKTEIYREGLCSMTGTLSVFGPRRPEADSLPCIVSAVEICGGRSSIVEQSCSLTVLDETVVITSKIVNKLKEKEGSIGYDPDNFALNAVSATKMTGNLVSVVTAPVEFRRANGGIT